MKQIILYILLFSFLCVNVPANGKVKRNIRITNLKTEYAETPLGMDVANPCFSWQMISEMPGSYQTAYQITVADENGKQVWNSKKVMQGISLNIRYSGALLEPCTRYQWTVNVWDQRHKKHIASSWFETGLMNPDPTLSAWSDACWIGGDDKSIPFYPDYLPVFKINASLQLDKISESVRAGIIYGANDNRLMDKNKNIYQLEALPDSSYILVELDVSPLNVGEEALLHVYRIGYALTDMREMPLKTFSIPMRIINQMNKYDKHTLSISSVFGDSRIYMDGEEEVNLIGCMNLNPLGKGGDFIAFPVVADIGLYVPLNQKAIFSDVCVRHYRSPSNVLYSVDSSPLELTGNEKDAYVIFNPKLNSMPMLRTSFHTKSSDVLKARLYVTARGIYEVYMNGKRIGNEYFHPGLTQYNKTHLYQTYDVTDCILQGNNALGAILGEGWWSGGSTYMGKYWNFFGDRQSLLAKLVITYVDGREDVIVTDPSSWTYNNEGPLVYGSFFQGEVYDATKELQVKDWTSASYDDAGWEKTVKIDLEGFAYAHDYEKMSLSGQFGDAVHKIRELTAVSVEEVRPGVFVYDMGQNMAGVPNIRLKGMEAGQKILLRFAEVKYPLFEEYKANKGMIMLENIRAAMSQDIYICKGGEEEIINPRFTYHGYRYLEITGIDRPLSLDQVKGEVLSSIHKLASHYETSNEKVNKLWKNITWSAFANFMSIPTDCPQRNERLGWSGDISVFSRTATYLADVSRFLRRHLVAMRDNQREDGHFPDVAPLDVGFGGLLWGSAGITVTWESYQQYGDELLLAENYDAMKRYIRYILDKCIDPQTNIIVQNRSWGDLGDWLGLEEQRNDKSLLWEAYFIYDLEIMQKVAAVLGKEIDVRWFEKLYADRKAFFNATYIDEKTGKTISSGFNGPKKGEEVDTQTSYVLPLAFHLIDEKNRAKVLENFKMTLTRENRTDKGTLCSPYSLMTGFIGTAWISEALSVNGYVSEAYRLLQQTSYPSWLYPVEQGATTIWERLNSYTQMDGFGGNNNMNSFNHYSFGAVGSWMYCHSLGIQRDEKSPGFKHFILAPKPDSTGMMAYAKGYYDSMYGRIESSWKMQGKDCFYHFVVPTNTSATLYLSASSVNYILMVGKPFSAYKGVKYMGTDENGYAFELESGIYDVQVRE